MQIHTHEASQSPNPQAAWGEQKPQPQAHFNPTDELAEAPVQATRGEQKPQPQGQAMPFASKDEMPEVIQATTVRSSCSYSG